MTTFFLTLLSFNSSLLFLNDSVGLIALIVKAIVDNITEIIMNEVRFVPANYIKIDKEKEEKVLALIDALEDLGDVSDVYHNLELED